MIHELSQFSEKDDLNNKADQILTSIIVTDRMSTEEIVENCKRAVGLIDVNNLYILDDSKSLDIESFYASSIMDLLHDLEQNNPSLNRVIKIIFLLRFIALLEQSASDNCAAALLQICELTLSHVKDTPFVTLQNMVREHLRNIPGNTVINTVFIEIEALLHSKMFVQYLKTSDWQNAYLVAYQNPEKSRKINSLRHLICYLCEKNELSTITNFKYEGCLNEVKEILLSRAKTSDLFISNEGNLNAMKYYEVLASLLIKRGEYLEVAKVYNDVFLRLQVEAIPKWMETDKYLEHLENALLPAVMFLSTSDRKWLTQKKLKVSSLSDIKACQDETEEIVTLADLRKKLLRIQKLKILSSHLYKQGFNSANLHSSMNAESIITHLCKISEKTLYFSQVVCNLCCLSSSALPL